MQDTIRTWPERFLRVWRMVRHRKLALAAMTTSGLISSFAESFGVSLTVLLIFLLLGRGADLNEQGILHRVLEWLEGVTGHSAVVVAMVIAAFIILKGVFSGVYAILSDFIRDELTRNVELEVLDRFMHSDFAAMQARGSGYMLSTIKNEPYYFARTMGALSDIIIAALSFSAYSAILILISFKLTLIIGLVGVVLLLTFYFSSGPLRRYAQRVAQLRDRLYVQLIGTVQALRTLRLFGAEGWSLSTYERMSIDTFRADLRLTIFDHVTRPIRDFSMLGALALVIWLSTSSGDGTVTTVAIVALLYRLLPHALDIESQLTTIAVGAPSLDRLLDVMDLPSVRRGSGDVEERPSPALDEICFDGVSFRYPGADGDSLRGVDLTIRAGQSLAIVGPSGSGKTTLVNLLGRLIAPTNGQIRVDGREVDGVSLGEWRKSISFAGQDLELIDGSIIDNLRLGDASITEEEAKRALAAAHILDVVEARSGGLHAQVGDRGLNLSGGQRQRLILARALARKPRFLVMDEATNAVDREMEHAIHRAVAAWSDQTTLIFVTHRWELALDADRVLVLHDGAVEAFGKPQDIFESIRSMSIVG